MKTRVDFISVSEDPRLMESIELFVNKLPSAKVEYYRKGEERLISKNKRVIQKRSSLFISCFDEDYDVSIINILHIYESLSSLFTKIEHDSFINLSINSNEMVSIEIGIEALLLLGKNNMSLPISVYLENE